MVTNGVVPPVEVERPPSNINEAPSALKKEMQESFLCHFLSEVNETRIEVVSPYSVIESYLSATILKGSEVRRN